MRDREMLETLAIQKIAELDGMREVLKWAEENVQLVEKTTDNRWACAWKDCRFTVQPTLYEALWSAWKSAHPTNKDVM